MDIVQALTSEFLGGLSMLDECIERCPDDLWIARNPPNAVEADPHNIEWNGVERPFWRIAFHTVYFTHLYVGQSDDDFVAPPVEFAVRQRNEFAEMWQSPWSLEPYELPTECLPSSRQEILEYLRYLVEILRSTIEGLDLSASSSGFHWYPDHSKLAHELMTLRHLMAHVGQLSELLMLRGIDIEWK